MSRGSGSSSNARCHVSSGNFMPLRFLCTHFSGASFGYFGERGAGIIVIPVESERGLNFPALDKAVNANFMAPELFRDRRDRGIIRLIDDAACRCFHDNAAFQTKNRKSTKILELLISANSLAAS